MMKSKSEDLHILLAVIDTGGFSSAAEQLDLHVTKVSRAVSRIETGLQTTLLNRTTRRLELTQEGRDFVSQVRQGLSTLAHAEETLLNRSGKPRGKLRIDAASPFVLHQIVPHVEAFNQEYPDIELELSSHEGYVDLLEHKTDIAIRIGHLSDSTLHARKLGTSDLYIVASPGYIAKHGAPANLSALGEHKLLGFIQSKNLNYWPLGEGQQIAPDIASSNGEVIRQLTLSGSGISCLSGFMINEDLKQGRLVSLFAQAQMQPSERRNIHALYYKTSAIARRIEVFLDFIQPRLTL